MPARPRKTPSSISWLRRVCLGAVAIALAGVSSLFALPAGAAEEDSLRGKLIGKVVCEANGTQSYALYVPSNYTKETRWPVIFCFDPSARGQIPVERLRGAAEKYGYVVAGSLTSRNGPYSANLAAAQAMVKDVSRHLSIDSGRLYTAGMSGGARVATSLALSGFVNGVIACGAGFPALEDGIPLRVPFVFFGIAGVEDFNLAELRRLDTELEDRDAVHHIATFDGPHVWAPESVLTQAVEWLELQAMRAGKKSRDEEFINATLAARQAALAKLSGLEKWRAVKALAADFKGLTETADFAREAAKLGASREVKDALKAEKRLFQQEPGLVEELYDASEASLARKQAVAAKFLRKTEAAGSVAERQMVRRAIAGYCSIALETSRDLLTQKNPRSAADLLELLVALRPDHARGWFDLARAYALSGDKKAALDTLGRAAIAGFNDDERMNRESAFAALRNNPQFQDILAKVSENRSNPVTELPAMRISSVLASVELRLFYQSQAGGGPPSISYLRVVGVRPGSAAEAAGVEVGMEITAIQGCRVQGLTEGELHDALEQPARGEIVFMVRDAFLRKETPLRIPIGKATAPVTSPSTAINKKQASVGGRNESARVE